MGKTMEKTGSSYFRFLKPEMRLCPPSFPSLHRHPPPPSFPLLLVIYSSCHRTSEGASSVKPLSTNLIIRTSLRA